MAKKIIAIVGGSGALGRSTTESLLKKGAQIVIGWFDPQEWEKFQADFAYAEDRIIGVEINVTDEASVKRFFDRIVEQYGRLDAMIYLAGIFSVGPMIWESDIEKLKQMIAVNTVGAFVACKYTIPTMLKQNTGNIILMPAKSVLYGTPHFGSYAVSKGALVTLMETLTSELKETDISVNCIMPDAMITPITIQSPHAEPDKWVSTDDVAEIIASICFSHGNIVRGAILKCFGRS